MEAPEGMTLVNPMTKIPREARMINAIKMIYATLCFLEHAFSDVKSKTNPTRFITSDTPPKMVKNQPFNVFIILMRELPQSRILVPEAKYPAVDGLSVVPA